MLQSKRAAEAAAEAADMERKTGEFTPYDPDEPIELDDSDIIEVVAVIALVRRADRGGGPDGRRRLRRGPALRDGSRAASSTRPSGSRRRCRASPGPAFERFAYPAPDGVSVFADVDDESGRVIAVLVRRDA